MVFAWKPDSSSVFKRAELQEAWIAIYHELAHAYFASKRAMAFSRIRIGKRCDSNIDVVLSGSFSADLEVTASGAAVTLLMHKEFGILDEESAVGSGNVDKALLVGKYVTLCGKTPSEWDEMFEVEIRRLSVQIANDSTIRSELDRLAKNIGDAWWPIMQAPFEGAVDFNWPQLSIVGTCLLS